MNFHSVQSGHSIVGVNTSNVNPENDINEECSICYESFNDKAFVNDCLHNFCKECILTWAKVNPVCPLCIQPITGIIINIRSLDDYDIEKILPLETNPFVNYDSDLDFAVDFTDAESNYGPMDGIYDSSNSEDSEPFSYTNDDVPSNTPNNLINLSNPSDSFSENSQDSFVNYGTVEDDQSDILSVDTNSCSCDEDDNDKDEYDSSEDENENDEYYEGNEEDEENNCSTEEDEDDEDDITNDDYEGDEDEGNEEDFQDYDFSDDEEESETSNFCDNYYFTIDSDNNEENEHFSSEYYEIEGPKDVDEEYDYIENDDDYSKFSYVNNTDSDQDSLSYDETADYIYSSNYC